MHLVSVAGVTFTGMTIHEVFDHELVSLLNQRNIYSVSELSRFLDVSCEEAELIVQPNWLTWASVNEARSYFRCIDKLGLDFKWLDSKIEKAMRLR